MNRRGFIRGGLAAVGGIAAASAIAPFGKAAAQETVALSLPSRDKFQLSHAYPKETKDGYTKFTLDRLMGLDEHFDDGLDERTAAVAYLRGELDLAAIEAGTPRPIIITNYSYDEPFKDNTISEKQRDFYERILPVLVANSHRPLVYLDVTAATADPQNGFNGVHLGALEAELKTNTLGSSDSHIEVDEGKFIVPYTYTTVDGEKALDSSFLQYHSASAVSDIENALARDLLHIVFKSNDRLLALSGTQP